jgi:hypothetical protein
VEHIWKCKHDTEGLWKKALDDLHNWLNENNSHPGITNLIIDGLSRWRNGNPTSGVRLKTHWLHQLGLKQDSCAWRNFFEGLLVTDWQEAMLNHLARSHSVKSPRRWISALIHKMWLIAWDLWEHRNGYLHAKETSLLFTQIDMMITKQFGIGTRTLDAPTKSLFKEGLQAVLSKPLEVKQQWHCRVLAARQNAALGHSQSYQSE